MEPSIEKPRGVNPAAIDASIRAGAVGGLGPASIIVTFALIGTLEGFLWPLGVEVRAQCAALLLLGLALTAEVLTNAGTQSTSNDRTRTWRRIVAWATVLTGTALLGATHTPAQIAGAALGLLGITQIVRYGNLTHSNSAATMTLEAATGTACASALIATIRLLPEVRAVFEGTAAIESGFLSVVLRQELQLGTTALGLDGALVTVLFALTLIKPWRRGATKLLLGWCAAILVLTVIYGALWAVWITTWRGNTREGFEEGTQVFQPLALLWMGHCLLLGILNHRSAIVPRTVVGALTRRRIVWPVATLAIVFAIDWAVKRLATPDRDTPGAAVLVRASDTDERYSLIDTDVRGYYLNESFTLFHKTLVDLGWHVSLATEHELPLVGPERADMLIFVYPATPKREQAAALAEFVSSGGRLLVVAEHTQPETSLETVNAVLDGAGITILFQSAFPNGTPVSDFSRNEAAFCYSRAATSAQDTYGVGAALEVRAPARVLLEARWGVGDRGNKDTSALIGNRHYEHGDSLANVPLIALSQLGRGSVCVVGDTGQFLDSSLLTSRTGIERLLSRMYYDEKDSYRAAALVASLIAIAIVLYGTGLPLHVWSVALTALVLALSHAIEPRRTLVHKVRQQVAVLDRSLNPSCSTFDRAGATSIKGLAHHFAIEGFLPVVGDDLEAELGERPHAMVLFSPSLHIDSKSIDGLVEYMTQGGHLWLVAGYEEREPLRRLLERLECDIAPVPLGSNVGLPGYTEKDVAYQEGWRVVAGHGIEAETELSASGNAIVMRRSIGRGTLLLVGDSYFFCDQGLESGEGIRMANSRFVRSLIGEL